MSYAPSSYINRYEAKTGFGMVSPSRHEDWRVRAIWARRAVNAAEVELQRWVNPSHEYDVASDWLWDKRDERQNVITSQWLHRLAARAQLRAA